jgi:hypothetical protein
VRKNFSLNLSSPESAVDHQAIESLDGTADLSIVIDMVKRKQKQEYFLSVYLLLS